MLALNKKNIKNPQTIGDFLNFAGFELKELENPQLEAEILLSFVLKKNRVWLKTNLKHKIKGADAIKFREILEKRKNNTPMAYILGYKIWHDLKIEVSPAVLIPRDETEILANYIWENSRDFKVKSILDIGTGSGCLSIFMGKKFPEAKITATDISTKALKVARENAKNLQVGIEFIESDLLEKIPQKNYDIIIANLPYVPENLEVSSDVKKEPPLAVFSGKDGLDLIRKLAEQLESREILFQELWLEFLPQQKEKIADIFAGFSVKFYPDLSGETYFARIAK